MTRHDEQELRARIVDAVPDVPVGLRDACVSPRLEQHADADLWRDVPRRRPRRWSVPNAIAAIVLLAAAVGMVLLLRGGEQRAAAQSLHAALDAFDEVTAIRSVITHDAGPGTETTWSAEFIGVLDLGFRFDDGDAVVLYAEAEGVRAGFDRASGRLEIIPVRDASFLRALFERTRADENVTVLRTIAMRRAGAVLLDRLELDERLVRRLRSVDEKGRLIAVELDVLTNRVLRTESWTEGYDGSPAVRVVTRFDYPDPASIDPSLFDPDALGATEVVELPGEHVIRQQCMANLRNLAMMVQLYGSQHADRMPATVEELAPYADQPLAAYLQVEVADRGEPLTLRSYLDRYEGSRINELDPAAVLFDYPFGDFTVAAFVDGHVEVLE